MSEDVSASAPDYVQVDRALIERAFAALDKAQRSGLKRGDRRILARCHGAERGTWRRNWMAVCGPECAALGLDFF